MADTRRHVSNQATTLEAGCQESAWAHGGRYWHGWHLRLDIWRSTSRWKRTFEGLREGRTSLVSPSLHFPRHDRLRAWVFVFCVWFVVLVWLFVVFSCSLPREFWSHFHSHPAVDRQCHALVRQCRKKKILTFVRISFGSWERVLWLEFFDVLVRKYTLLSVFGFGSSLTGSCFPYQDLIFVCYTKVAGSCFPYNFNSWLIWFCYSEVAGSCFPYNFIGVLVSLWLTSMKSISMRRGLLWKHLDREPFKQEDTFFATLQVT